MELFYKKGKKYLPVNSAFVAGDLHDGAWLVMVENGVIRSRELVEPNHAAVEAALFAREDMVVAAMVRAMLNVGPNIVNAGLNQIRRIPQRGAF